MPISINWETKVIFIPKADMSLVQTSPYEVRELDLDVFRLALKDLEDGEEGMIFDDTHRHNTEVLLGGVTYARSIEIINDYTVTFEDDQYAVNLVGANSNVGDVLNLNQVSVRSANSAGLISVDTGGGGGTPSAAQIAAAVWDQILTSNTHNIVNSAGRRLRQSGTRMLYEGKIVGTGTVTVFDTDLAQTEDNFYSNQLFIITTGALAGQARIIQAYDGTTKQFTFYKPWTAIPANDDQFEIHSEYINSALEITTELDLIQTDLTLIKGLVKHNFKMTDLVYNAGNKMTSAKMKIYPTPLDLQNSTNEIAVYVITAAYNGSGQLVDYKVVPE